MEALSGFEPTKYVAFENSSAEANFKFYTCSFSKFIGLLAYQKLQINPLLNFPVALPKSRAIIGAVEKALRCTGGARRTSARPSAPSPLQPRTVACRSDPSEVNRARYSRRSIRGLVVHQLKSFLSFKIATHFLEAAHHSGAASARLEPAAASILVYATSIA